MAGQAGHFRQASAEATCDTKHRAPPQNIQVIVFPRAIDARLGADWLLLELPSNLDSPPSPLWGM